MTTSCRSLRPLAAASSLLVLLALLAVPVALARDPTEAEVLAALELADPDKVADALQHYEKKFPESEKARAKAIQLLSDSRSKVRRKAARVLGVLHVKLSEEQLREIVKLLSATDKAELVDGLKALRDLEYRPAVPAILPLLTNVDDNVKRDACRTLAVIADASVVPQIEPLLAHKEKKVQEDARIAIARLKNK